MPDDGREGLTTQEQIDQMYKELEQASRSGSAFKSGLKTFWRWVISILFYGAMLSLLLIYINISSMRERGETPTVLGYSLNKVISSSMEPTYPVGSILLGKEIADKNSVQIGTVVRFLDASGLRVVHRVIRRETDSSGSLYYVTKGDNPHNVEDPDPLKPANVEAEIIYMLPEIFW